MAIPELVIKTCSGCSLEKHESQFFRSKTGKFGLTGKCKPCTREANRKYWSSDNGKARRERYKNTPSSKASEYKSARTIKRRYSVLKKSAKKKQIYLDITFEQYSEVWSATCMYCGYMLGEAGHGLDRKSNDKQVGYTLSNVVPCCGWCNMIKGDRLSYEEMCLLSPVLRLIRSRRSSA